MKRISLIVIALSLLAVVVKIDAAPADAEARRIAHGKYIVEQVAMCGDCHSPRNEKGEFDRSKWLQGAPIDFKPTHPVPKWEELAPALAGLPKMKEGDVVKFLETAHWPDGRHADAPMPAFHLSHADAVAVVAYLKSLKAADK